MTEKLSYCGQVVKEQDPDRFLLSMFMPQESREALWALFAFNHEVAKTCEVVSETQLGLIRLQWWREQLANIYQGGDIPEHEVLNPLADAIKTHGLAQEDFETLIYAREFDLEGVLPANMEGLLNYADFTSVPLMRMAMQINGGAPEIEPVQPVAVNYALAGILRAAPFHARQGRCFLPADLLKRHDVKEQDIYKGKSFPGLKSVIKEIAEGFVPGVNPRDPFLALSQGLAHIYFKQIKNARFDVFSPKMALPPAFKALRLWLFSYYRNYL